MQGPDVVVTPNLLTAMQLAGIVHGRDLRKGTGIPYMAHLLGVCALVLNDGGDEDEAVAALLHDALEDHPERVTAEEIQAWFGARVAAIVVACTDTPPDRSGGPKPPWRARKEAYLSHIRSAEPRLLRVSLADKLDNARAILADLREIGDGLWSRFNAGKDQQLWYYRSLVEAFRAAGMQGRMMEELARTVAGIEALAGSSAGGQRDQDSANQRAAG